MARDWVKITTYWLRYDVGEGKCQVGIRFLDTRGSEETIRKESFALPAADALFLADMLRNEEPIYWNPSKGAIATGEGEPVGEGE